MSILDARLNTSLDGRALDSFIVVDESTRDAVTDSERLETLKSDLVDACSRPREIKPAGQSSTRELKSILTIQCAFNSWRTKAATEP